MKKTVAQTISKPNLELLLKDLKPEKFSLISSSPGYLNVGNNLAQFVSLFLKRESFLEIFNWFRSQKLPFSDQFLETKIKDFLYKYYFDKQNQSLDEFLTELQTIKPENTDILIHLFNVRIKTEELDMGSFILFDPVFFWKKYNPNTQPDNRNSALQPVHSLLLFKNVQNIKE